MKTKYAILTDCGPRNLEEKVNQSLRDGWKLHGGLVVTGTISNGLIYAQAMVKEYN